MWVKTRSSVSITCFLQTVQLFKLKVIKITRLSKVKFYLGVKEKCIFIFSFFSPFFNTDGRTKIVNIVIAYP